MIRNDDRRSFLRRDRYVTSKKTIIHSHSRYARPLNIGLHPSRLSRARSFIVTARDRIPSDPVLRQREIGSRLDRPGVRKELSLQRHPLWWRAPRPVATEADEVSPHAISPVHASGERVCPPSHLAERRTHADPGVLADRLFRVEHARRSCERCARANVTQTTDLFPGKAQLLRTSPDWPTWPRISIRRYEIREVTRQRQVARRGKRALHLYNLRIRRRPGNSRRAQRLRDRNFPRTDARETKAVAREERPTRARTCAECTRAVRVCVCVHSAFS